MPSFDRPADPDIAPSAWVMRFASLITPGGTVLDLACGHGRHVRYLASLGYQVIAADIDMSFEEFAPSESLTEPRCRAGNVRQGHTVMRTIFCVRGYIDFPDLYDATVKAAVLGARDVGLITTLTLSGVSFANAERIAREFLTRIRWRDQ